MPAAGSISSAALSFDINEGEIVALIGESGSGKTTIALTLMGHARQGCRVSGGQVLLAGKDMASLPEKARARIRGTEVAYIPQSAAAAFNPAQTIMEQVIEITRIHNLMPVEESKGPRRRALQGAKPAEPGDDRRTLSASGVRRSIAAPFGRDGADRRPETSDFRRADDGARRDDADRGSPSLQIGDEEGRHCRRLRVPRPCGRGAGRRPDRRFEEWRSPGNRRDRTNPLCALSSLYTPVAWCFRTQTLRLRRADGTAKYCRPSSRLQTSSRAMAPSSRTAFRRQPLSNR